MSTRNPIYMSTVALILTSGGAMAEEAASEQNVGELQEVVVTAQKRVEDLQKSSLALQVVSGKDLAQAGVSDPKDLNALVPGLQVAKNGSAVQIFIRGIGDPSTTELNNPAVAFNVDGVYVARSQGVGLTFYDVDRIEVLKGPQGTLYGRNASGGALNLITTRPRLSDLSGQVTAEGGNFSLKHGTGAINVPLGDTFALRGAFDVTDRDGYLSDGTEDDKHEAGRIRALWQPSETLSLLTSVDYARAHGTGPGQIINPRPPGSTRWLGSTELSAINYLAAQPPNGALTAYGIPGVAPGLSAALTNRPTLSQNAWNISTELNYDMDWATLTVLPAYRDFRNEDLTYPGFRVNSTFHSKEFTTEARLSHNTEDLKWVAGLYYFHETVPGRLHADGGVFNVSDELYPTNTTRSYAAFGQATYSVVQDFRLIAGGRYTSDWRKVSGETVSIVPVPGNQAFEGSKTFISFTWKAGLEYDLAPDNMLFLTASTGFKAGGFNQEVAPNSFDPEKLTAYELGLRNRFLNDRLQVNIELFKWDYKDHQESVATFDTTFKPNFLTFNAGKASLEGGSLDIVAAVSSQDTVRGFVEYNNARYDSFILDAATFGVIPGISTGCPVGPSPKGPAYTTVDCSGFQLARAPRWTGNLSWAHRFALPNGASLSANVGADFASSRWGSVDFTSLARVPSYVRGNVDLTYAPQSDRWSLTGYVHNVSNRVIASGVTLQPYQPTVAFESLEPPRTYGGRISVNF